MGVACIHVQCGDPVVIAAGRVPYQLDTWSGGPVSLDNTRGWLAEVEEEKKKRKFLDDFGRFEVPYMK